MCGINLAGHWGGGRCVRLSVPGLLAPPLTFSSCVGLGPGRLCSIRSTLCTQPRAPSIPPTFPKGRPRRDPVSPACLRGSYRGLRLKIAMKILGHQNEKKSGPHGGPSCAKRSIGSMLPNVGRNSGPESSRGGLCHLDPFRSGLAGKCSYVAKSPYRGLPHPKLQKHFSVFNFFGLFWNSREQFQKGFV